MTSKCYYNQPGALSSYEPTEDGGLMIHGVTIMAAGSWTDMHGIHTTFTEEVLQRCVGQWADNAVWTRHSGGAPRSVTEKIGAVVNPYYDPERAAVMADVYLHNKTETSAGASALVQLDKAGGGIKDVSAETLVELSPDGTVMDVTFTGLALVEDGACEVCKLPAYGKQQVERRPDTEDTKEPVEFEDKDGAADPAQGEEEQPETETKTEAGSDLQDMLVGFIEGLIPDTKGIIDEILAAEGEERTRALGKLEGCMSAWGFDPAQAFGKLLDEKLAEFGKALGEKIDAATQANADFAAPSGLKGRMGADKPVQETPRSYTFTTKNRGFDRTPLF